MGPATLADMHEWAKLRKELPVGASVNVWLQRFAAFDAEEEEVIDQSSSYRALLRDQAHDQGAADASVATKASERKLRKPTP